MVFPIVWLSLYVAMSYAAMRVAQVDGSQQALAFWAMQIAFNTLWSPVFFGLRRMRAAMVILSCLWVAVALTLVSFYLLDPLAGYLIAPYLLWVTIAGGAEFLCLAAQPAICLRQSGETLGTGLAQGRRQPKLVVQRCPCHFLRAVCPENLRGMVA